MTSSGEQGWLVGAGASWQGWSVTCPGHADKGMCSQESKGCMRDVLGLGLMQTYEGFGLLAGEGQP